MPKKKWEEYFCFGTGTEFEVDGPLVVNGDGKVNLRSDFVLELMIKMDELPGVPDIKPIKMWLQYEDEGAVNKGVITYDNKEYKDDKAKMTSGETVRKVEPSITIPGFALEWFTFENKSEKEVEFIASVDGSTWEFDLEKK